MNKIAMAMGISALMVLCVLAPCINELNADPDNTTVNVEDAIKNAVEQPVAVIDSAIYEKLEADSISMLESAVMDGKPVIFEGSSEIITIDGVPKLYSTDSEYSGVYYNKEYNAACYFGATGINAKQNAEAWANNIESRVVLMGHDGDSNYYTFDDVAESDDYKLYAEISFIKVGVDADDTYYVVHHKANPIIKDTSNDREIADVTVSCTLGNSSMTLEDTSPEDSGNPIGVTTIDVELAAGTSGIDLSDSGTWVFTSRYMTVDNDTDYQDGTYKFFFDFNEEVLSGIIKDASEMGFELFLLDDGWFGTKHPRNSDNAGLGDWQVNKNKLPNGLGYLVEEADKNGIKFGIWLEPEMVNPV